MLKRKFKVIAILFVIILTLTLPMVRAENKTADDIATPDGTASKNTANYDIAPISEEEPTPEAATATTEDKNLKKSDVYLTGDDVTIDYIVDGNLFVVANHVTINSQIGGDAFICANTVTIGEQGYVFSNLFTFAKNVTVNGVVYDLYSASENITITGYVYRDIRVGCNTINIFGSIGRNAFIDCASLNFAQDSNVTGNIHGNLRYSAKQEISIPEGVVTGETKFEQEIFSDDNTIQTQILSLGTFVVTIVVIWLLCLWLTPKLLKNNTSLLTTKKILPVIGFGILAPIVGILSSILLLVLGITSTLGLLLLFTLFILIAISTSVFVITVNYVVCDKLKIQKTIGVFGMLIVSSIVLWLVGLIPYIGSIVSFASIVIGLGMILSNLILKRKTTNSKELEKTE